MPAPAAHPRVDVQLLQRYDRPGPRYTSYPTAVEFREGFPAEEYAARLGRLPVGESLSLYIHLPFCQHRCTFCGCHVVITPHREVAAKYLGYVERELELLSRHLPARPKLDQHHWGGGTPTYYSPAEMARLHQAVARHFEILPGAEVAVEVDPRVTTRAHVDMLAELGFNRISMGVQDFTPAVQEAIGRNQGEAETRELFAYCRQKGFASVNIDLIYGLPGQTEETFQAGLDAVVELRPERVAVYSYAHVPWIRSHQKRLDTGLMPSRDGKFALFARAIRTFREAGYAQLGMDHFALPGDELATALEARRLHRNFMGVHRAADAAHGGGRDLGHRRRGRGVRAERQEAEHLLRDAGRWPAAGGARLRPHRGRPAAAARDHRAHVQPVPGRGRRRGTLRRCLRRLLRHRAGGAGGRAGCRRLRPPGARGHRGDAPGAALHTQRLHDLRSPPAGEAAREADLLPHRLTRRARGPAARASGGVPGG
ncbi:MAG: oxygen-independent coproporphyrinogen III oxidase [Gemmatimonadota bacterium]